MDECALIEAQGGIKSLLLVDMLILPDQVTLGVIERSQMVVILVLLCQGFCLVEQRWDTIILGQTVCNTHQTGKSDTIEVRTTHPIVFQALAVKVFGLLPNFTNLIYFGSNP